MQRLSFLGLFLLALLLNACSDDGASPNDKPTNDEKKEEHGFAIVSVDRDSVYWGEPVIVTFRKAQTEISKLFVHTVPVEIDSVWQDDVGSGGIRFRATQNTPSGLIRLFDLASRQAAGRYSLFVYPKLRSAMAPRIQYFMPRLAYSGDIVTIVGKDFPMLKRDMHLSVNGAELPIESWDSTTIIARAPGVWTSGPLVVKIFDSVFRLDTLVKLNHEGVILQAAGLCGMTLYSSGLKGFVRTQFIQGTDTTTNSVEKSFTSDSKTVGLPIILAQQFSDSLIYADIHSMSATEKLYVDVRLKTEPESRVSGTIKLSYDLNKNLVFWEAEIKGMHWRRIDKTYRIYSDGKAVKKELVSYNYGYISGTSGSETHVYTDTDPSPNFFIDLTAF